MVIKKVAIFGERCSGTNYLMQLLGLNFDVEIIWSYGWKHFFGFSDVGTNSDDVLFIGIVRNLEDWINSLYRAKHHFRRPLINNVDTFLNYETSSYSKGEEIMQDRNIETNERYKNIFELRHVKNKYLVETMPNLVKNYCLITYDSLVHRFDSTMNLIKNYDLQVKNNMNFPLNVDYYNCNKRLKYDAIKDKKPNTIPKEIILPKANMHYEKILFPEFCYEVVVPEFCDEVVVPEFCDEVVVPEFCDEVLLPESCDEVLLPESCDEALVPESCDEVLVTESCDEVLVTESCDEVIVNESCDEVLVNEFCDEVLVPELV